MPASRTWFVVAVVVSNVITVGSVRAQVPDPGATRDIPSPSASAETRQAYERSAKLGFEEFELGHYAEARARFLEAEALYENAGILRALAMVEYELRRYPASIAFAERALASDERPLRTAQRADTERLLALARGYVARYRITLIPADAQLTLDGSPVARDALGAVFVPVGAHVLEARADHHHAAQRAIHVFGAEDVALTMLLVERPEPRAEGTPLRRKWWLWTGISALAAGLTVGLVLGLRNHETTPYENSSGAVITVPLASGATP